MESIFTYLQKYHKTIKSGKFHAIIFPINANNEQWQNEGCIVGQHCLVTALWGTNIGQQQSCGFRPIQVRTSDLVTPNDGILHKKLHP